MEFVNPNIRPERYQISYASNGFGIFEFLDLCKQANVSAVLSINEKDDGDGFIEYLWGTCVTINSFCGFKRNTFW